VRNAFFAALGDLARDDERVELVVGDVGYGAMEAFAEEFPDRVLNAGIAEQNMTGVATGLALTGSVVFTYSIANFPTLRCLEQLRNDACYHRANVKVVAVGGGLSYGSLGMSHHATEDLAILRALPGMAVAVAGDAHEARALTGEVGRLEGPAYLRLGKAGEPTVHTAPPSVPPGSSVVVAPGDDVALLACGSMLPIAVEVSLLLAADGIAARVVSVPWISPIDEDAVWAAAETQLVVTMEEHSVVGGLGGAVAELLAERTSAPLLRIGLPHRYESVVGDQEFLRRRHGLDAASVADRIRARARQTSAGPTSAGMYTSDLPR
jgi:transketolase